MAAESFDAVLADIRPSALSWRAIPALSNTMAKLAYRLQAAHEREVARFAELEAMYLQQGLNIVAANKRADAAVALLRDISRNWRPPSPYMHTCCREVAVEICDQIDAFLAQQDNGQEKGNG